MYAAAHYFAPRYYARRYFSVAFYTPALTSSLTATSSTATADLVASQAKVSNLTVTNSTADAILALSKPQSSNLTVTSDVAVVDLLTTSSLTGYFAATYFPSRYFAPYYFSGDYVSLELTGYFAATYFSPRYYAQRYFASSYESIDERLKPLHSNLTINTNIINTRLIIDRYFATTIEAQTSLSIADIRINRLLSRSLVARLLIGYEQINLISGNQLFLVSSPTTPIQFVEYTEPAKLIVRRTFVSAKTITTITTTPRLTMGNVIASSLTITSELSYPILHLNRALSLTPIVRSSTEAWSQSVSSSWTDPTPENTASYQLEWRLNSAPSFIITGILTTSHTWSAWVDVGDVIYVRTRAVSADADPVYSEWSEWSDGWTVPSTPHRAILDVPEGTLYSIKTITSNTQNTRLRLLQQKASSLTVTSATADVDLSVRTIPISSTLITTTNVANADLNYSQAKVSNITVISDVANADWSRSLAIITDRTITSVTDVATLFISSSHPQTSALTITSSTANADSIINRRISSSTTCSTNTVNADVIINRRLGSTITATSSTQTADLLPNRALTSGLTATTLVVNGDIRISRPFQTTLTSTTTTSLADAIVNRRIYTNQTITSNVANASFENGTLRSLVSTLSINSSIDINNWWIQRGLSSTKSITTDIQSWLRIQRPIESAKTITSSTADADLSSVKLLNKSSFVTVSSDVNGSIKVSRPLSGTIIANSNGIGEIAVSRALFCTLTTTTTTQSAYLSTYLIQGVITANVTPLGTTGSPINVNESLLQSIAQQTLRVT